MAWGAIDWDRFKGLLDPMPPGALAVYDGS